MFLKIKYNELNTKKFINVAIDPEIKNLNIWYLFVLKMLFKSLKLY